MSVLALVAMNGAVFAAGPAAAARESGGLSPTHANLTKYTSQQLIWSTAVCPQEVRELGKAAERSQCARVRAPKGYTDAGVGQHQCAYWPYRAKNSKVDLSGSPKILLLQNTLDPATPYEGALDAHRSCPKTVLLIVNNQRFHGAVLGSKNTCVTDAAYGFLVNGTQLQRDSACQGRPLPGDSTVYPVGRQVPGPSPSDVQPKSKTPPQKSDNLGETLLDLLSTLVGDILGGPHA